MSNVYDLKITIELKDDFEFDIIRKKLYEYCNNFVECKLNDFILRNKTDIVILSYFSNKYMSDLIYGKFLMKKILIKIVMVLILKILV